uniref:Nedd4 family interacting protein 2 n=1 Tax=Tetraodon nigroviridis TaxID=99883 RepID=H3C996_TETNG
MNNEDDSSEASSSEQPCTSAQAAASSQDRAPAPAPPTQRGRRGGGALGIVEPVNTETSFQGDFPVPPPYSVATSLPTYDEAEKAKAAAMAASSVEVIARYHRQDDEFIARDDFSDADQLRVGNDGIFMLAFFSK